MNVKSHSRHQEVFMNFHYSYPPLWVSRPHSRTERAFHPYSPLWVSNLTVGLKESLSLLFTAVTLTLDIKRPSWTFITPIHPYECHDLIVGLKELFILIHPRECQTSQYAWKKVSHFYSPLQVWRPHSRRERSFQWFFFNSPLWVSRSHNELEGTFQVFFLFFWPVWMLRPHSRVEEGFS